MRQYKTTHHQLTYGLVCLGIFLVICITGCRGVGKSSGSGGEYFGQTPPGFSAELFAEGYLSTALPELNSVFFPGGREVLSSVQLGQMKWAMLLTREVEGVWNRPEIAPFSGRFGGVDPFITADGKRVYFCSNRPREGESGARSDYDIWFVDRTGTGWSQPVNVGPPVNSEANEFYPSLTSAGVLYFQSHREGGVGRADIYRSIPENGRFTALELLPETINSPDFEGDALIAPDESYLMVSTYRAGVNIGNSSDLYISFRTGMDWGKLINMGPEINSEGGENCQILSPCGRFLFFTSRRQKEWTFTTYDDIIAYWDSPENGYGDIYWVDAGIIERLREKASGE